MGYVRADMIEKKGDGDIPAVSVAAESQDAPASSEGDTADAQGAEAPASGGGAQVEAQEAVDLQYASTNVQAKVRASSFFSHFLLFLTLLSPMEGFRK